MTVFLCKQHYLDIYEQVEVVKVVSSQDKAIDWVEEYDAKEDDYRSFEEIEVE